ncbi:MAG TPA: TonB-dependent receptor [Chitinophagales bacterium]|nr:TonB-dependent receptor [Chitinophagales bacterium]
MRAAIATLFLFSFAFSLQAQTLKGKVFGQGETEKEILPGATVVWIGTSISAIANENGVFEITTDSVTDKRLAVSFVGYEPDTITIANQTYVSITLRGAKALEEVTITGEKSSAYISEVNPIKTEVITQKELTKAACCDLAGCFSTQASVQPTTTNIITNAQELRILGLSGVYNQVLFDGMPLFQGLTYTYGISSYPGVLIDNIFVSKGANSVLQGFESISGQINVIPKMPDNTDKLLLNAYVNSFLERHFNANFAAPIGKKKKRATLLAFHTVQPAKKFDKDDDTFLDLPRLTRYMAYSRWKLGDEKQNGITSHIGLRFLNEQRIGGQENFNPETDKGTAAAYGQTVHYSQPEFYTKTGCKFNDDHALVLIASAFYQKQNSWFGTVKYDAEQVNAYADLQHEFLWQQQHLLKYGASFRYQHLDEHIGFSDTIIPRTYAGGYLTRQIVPGIFAENTFHWNNDKVVWILGARYDHHQQFGSYFTPRTLIKYAISTGNTVRASAGTGWRQVNLFPENVNLLASSRDLVFAETLQPEKGLNWGVNYTYRFEKGKAAGTLSADFYQTCFFNQFFPDYDSDATKAIIKNFTGKSISNGFQAEANFKFFKAVEWKAAYNFLDVYRMENGEKNVLPFNPQHRVMVALSFRPANNKWYVDLNTHWYDKQKLPNTSAHPEAYQRPDYSKPYFLVNGQVTYNIKWFEIYAGCENIFNFRQEQPIISWQEPFGKYFDTSSVWGPTRGREIYGGVRFRWE